MGADDGNSIARTPLSADGERDDGGAVAGQVVFAAGAEGRGPGVTLADDLEAGLLESLDGGVDGMVGCRGGAVSGGSFSGRWERG